MKCQVKETSNVYPNYPDSHGSVGNNIFRIQDWSPTHVRTKPVGANKAAEKSKVTNGLVNLGI